MLKVKCFPKMGRGLIATQTIRKGQIVHTAELIQLSRKDAKTVSRTLLDSYVYCLGSGTVGLALGLGSLFNHRLEPNTEYSIITKAGRKCIQYKATMNIKAGEQLFIDYGYDPEA